jgi:hypothetical protein
MGNITCPSTGIKLMSIQLAPNYVKKAAIQKWRQGRDGSPTSVLLNEEISYPPLKV